MGFAGSTNFPGSAVVLASNKPIPDIAVSSGGGGRAHGRRRGMMLPALSLRNSHSNGSSGGGSRPSSMFSNGEPRARRASATTDHVAGIGIAGFLGGKNFLITGGTGFLAKVLIEKILRTNPEVGKIYIVIKAKDTAAALKRLQTEVVETELFKCLKEIQGKDYHSFVARKLVPVIGDIRDTNLGIAHELADKIRQEVDIIVNSAGNTTFHERYDVAMDINTLGPFRIMSFAQKFRRLKLFLHVSTACVNGKRQGVVLEKPFRLGDSIANETLRSIYSSEPKKCVVLDIEAEIKLAFDSVRHSDDLASFTQEMKDLGLKRAKLHGWQDTYVFTKAMGEMVINSMRGEIPVVAIRPSVIESTLRDPFPGWIQGNRMLDPIITYYGRGQMSSFLADPDCIIDVVPADMVVNATLASIAKHGGAQGAAPGMHVYHVASSTAKPLVFHDLFEFIYQHFRRSPLIDGAGQPIPVQPMRFCDSMEQYAAGNAKASAPLRWSKTRCPSSSSGRPLRQQRARAASDDVHAAMAVARMIIHLGRIYEPYTFYGGRFDTANTEGLLAEMSEQETTEFPFDVRGVDWKDYFTNVHVPGVRKHVMKGRGSDHVVESAALRQSRLI